MTEPKLRELLKALGVQVVQRTPEDWLLCHCPFAEDRHAGGKDRNPSFMVSIKQAGVSGFNCWSCKSKGGMGKLIRQLGKLHGEDYQELYMQAALDETPSDFGDFEIMMAEEEVPQPLNPAQFVGMFIPAWEERAARRYLIGRGIGQATTKKLNMLYDPDEMRILFPVYGRTVEELYGFTGRSILPDAQFAEMGERYRKVKDYAGLKKSHRLLGEHLIKKGRPPFVHEGLFGQAHLIEIGADKVCSPLALMGSVLHTHQRAILIEHDMPVYLCLDDDLAGDIGLYGKLEGKDHAGGGAVDMLREELPTHVVRYPEGVEDIEEFTLAHVKEALADKSLS